MPTAEGPSVAARLLRLTEVASAFLVATLLALGVGGSVLAYSGSVAADFLSFFVTYLLGYGALGGAALGYVRVYQNTNALDVAAPSLLDVRDVLVGFLVVLLGVAALAAVAAVAGLPVVHEGSLGEPIEPPLLLTALPLSLLVGIPAQELLFRNGFQKRLDERFPTWVAVGVPSLLMVLLTLGPFAGAPALGLVVPALAVALASNAIGWVYARSGTVLASWALHAALTVALLSVLYLDASTALELHSLA